MSGGKVGLERFSGTHLGKVKVAVAGLESDRDSVLSTSKGSKCSFEERRDKETHANLAGGSLPGACAEETPA